MYGVEEWKEDIKKILKYAGKKKDAVFYFSDSQIK